MPWPDRAGNITGYFEEPGELQNLATKRSRAVARKVTTQLPAEALNDLFKRYNKPELVP